MLIDSGHIHALHETPTTQPQSDIDTQTTPQATDEAAQLSELRMRVTTLEEQLSANAYVLQAALGAINRSLLYEERARTVGDEKAVVPNAITSQRLADQELQNAALPIASYFGNFQHGEQWVKEYVEAILAVRALEDVVRSSV